MSDIFISYANTDREKAKTIAQALESKGWSVWWDRKIPPGKTFAQVIKEELDDTNCIVALWSAGSVDSDWVHNEAAEGAQRKILVPALIEDVKIPFEFRRIQAARLVDWQPRSQHEEFDEFIASIEALIGSPKSEEQESQSDNLKAVAQQENSSEMRGEGKQPIPEEMLKHKSKNAPLIKRMLLNIPISMTYPINTPIDSIKLNERIKWMLVFAALGIVYIFLGAVYIFITANEPTLTSKAGIVIVLLGSIPGAISGLIIGRPTGLSMLLTVVGMVITGVILWFMNEAVQVILFFPWVIGLPAGAIATAVILSTIKRLNLYRH